jgi:hypothetical protein
VTEKNLFAATVHVLEHSSINNGWEPFPHPPMTNRDNPYIYDTLFVCRVDPVVTVTPADDEMFGGAIVTIGFSAGGRAYGINTELAMGADDSRRWRLAVDAALRDAAPPRRQDGNVIALHPPARLPDRRDHGDH